MRIPRHARLLLSLAGLAAAIPCVPHLAARSAQVRTIAGAPPQPGQAQAPLPAPRGTGLVLGQVVDAASGRPVAAATVDFNGRAASAAPALPGRGGAAMPAGRGPAVAPVQIRIQTDAEGRFVLHDLPKGQFSFNVSAPGYLGGGYGQRSPTGQSRPFELDEGERIGDLKLLVWKYGAIAGTVVDESGEPVVGIQVRALRRLIVGGKPRLTQGPSGSTDDRGAFRLFNLSPGDYVVGVASTQTTVPVSSITAYEEARTQGRGGQSPAEFSRQLSASGAPFPTQSGYRVGESLLVQPEGNGRTPITPAPADNGAIVVYQPVFYPSVSVSSQATPVRIASGEERTGIDLQLRLVRALRVSGSVMGPDGPAANLGVHLIPGGADDLSADNSLEAATTATDLAGNFTFLGVPAGQYTLHILKVPRPVPVQAVQVLAAVGRGVGAGIPIPPPPPPPPAMPTEPVLWAQMPVTVAETDVLDLSVAVRTGIRVSGRFQFDGAAQQPTPDQLQRATVSLSPADGRSVNQAQPGRGSSAGTFSTMGYPPGKYFVSAGIPAPGWTFKTATLGGRDLIETPLELDSGDVSGVTIVFTDRQTQLTGRVQDARNAANVDATIVIFPAAYQPWFDNGMNGRRWRTARTSRSGDFAIGSLPPGDYLIVALTDEPGREVLDSRYFTALAGIATRVSLAEGDKQTQDLTIIKTPTIGGTNPPSPTQTAPEPGSQPLQNPQPPQHPQNQHVPFDDALPAQQPQIPARDNPGRPSVGTAAITGSVRSDDASGRPIRRVIVSLNGGNLRTARVTVTDDAGHFVFTALPPGRYSASVSKPAYVSSAKPGQPAPPIQLTEGQTLDVTLKMMHGAAITGMVIGPTGQPTPGVQIQLMQYRLANGERQLVMVGSSGNNTTDDRGVFRIYGLAAGEYILAASRNNSFQGDAHATTPGDIQWAQQALRLPSAASPGSSVQTVPLPPAPASGPAVGYASVFYPGTPDATSATPIKLSAGEERTGIDVPLQFVVTSRVQGTVVGPDGQPVQNVQMTLTSKALPSSVRLPFMPSIQRTQDGKFTANGVPPGDYMITARTTNPGPGVLPVMINGIPMQAAPPVPPVPPAGPSGAAPAPAPVLWGIADFSVNGTDITDLVLTLQRGMTVSGRLAFEGTTIQPPADVTRTRVTLGSMPGQGAVFSGSAPSPSQVDASGNFTIENVLPGRYRLAASIPLASGRGGGPGVPAGPPAPGPGQGVSIPWWTLKSAIVNGVDALDFPVEIRPNENLRDVMLTFTDRQTEISGTLMNQAGKPAPDFSIIVFTTERTFWTPFSRRIRQSRPSPEGAFRVVGLPAGDYYVSAVADFEPGQVNDPAFLDQLVGASFKITLAEGEKKTQDLKLAGGNRPIGH